METTIEIHRPVATFGGSFSHGWRTMMKYFLILLLVTFIMAILSGPFKGGGNFDFDKTDWNNFDFNEFFFSTKFAVFGMLAFFAVILALAYNFLLVPVFKFGSDLIFVQAARDQRPQFEALILGFKERYLHVVLSNLLVTALIMMGFIFFIIPGIIVWCRLIFVSYLVMDKKLDPVVAVEESWKLTRGHGWRIFAMGLVSIFIFILGLVLLIIGTLPAVMWIKSSFASLYEAVLIQKNGNGELNK